MVGRTVLHYEITAELGAGGVGRVYLAIDRRAERRVALKFLDPAMQDSPTRLIREARAAARLSHPGVVALLAVEEVQGEHFLVEEYVEGETLARRLERGPLGRFEALRLASEMAAALAHAHEHGVLHRDLTPANILIAVDGTYKIADFGIARIEGSVSTTEAGVIRGTLSYMAPERMRGFAGDVRADLFSFGSILYEAITGRRAFPGQEAEVIYGILNLQPPAPEPHHGHDEVLAAVVTTLLAKEPSERPPNAKSVMKMLAPARLEAGLATVPPMKQTGGMGLTRWMPAAGPILIAVLAIGGFAVWRSLNSVAPVTAAPIVVLPFDNVEHSMNANKYGVIASTLLVSRLAEEESLDVVGSERTLEAWQEASRLGGRSRPALRQVAHRLRAQRIVSGSILRDTLGFLITAEVSDAPSGKVIEAARVDGLPGETIFQIADRLGERLVSALVGRSKPVQLAGGAAGTLDLDAYRFYVEGLEHLARGSLDQAEGAFSAALQLDPGFKQAATYLAVTRERELLPSERVLR